jgi:hypothetical protein
MHDACDRSRIERGMISRGNDMDDIYIELNSSPSKNTAQNITYIVGLDEGRLKDWMILFGTKN